MKNIEILQFKNNSLETITDNIAEECILHLVINSQITFDVLITPTDIKEFVFGNLYSEGFIKTKDEVTSYKELIKDNLINVNIKIKDFEDKKIFLKKNYNIVWAECGSGGEISRYLDIKTPLENKLQVNGKDLLLIAHKIKDKIELFKLTGAFHYAFIFDKDFNIISYTYDIGRHNAMDKVIGGILLNNITNNFEDFILYTTGRVTSDLIFKCLRCKLSMVISRGAPLDRAVELAKKYNICLIGFLRGERFNIYSYPESIKID